MNAECNGLNAECNGKWCCCKREVREPSQLERTNGVTECCCHCCANGRRLEPFFKVTPYKWTTTAHAGESYLIQEVKTLATSRCRADADKIVERLNSVRQLERKAAKLAAQLSTAQNDERCKVLSEVRLRSIEVHTEMSNWGTASTLKMFYERVMQKLRTPIL